MIVGDLKLNDIRKICSKGCDDCPRELVKACKQTGYMLCMLEQKDLNKKIEVKTNGQIHKS